MNTWWQWLILFGVIGWAISVYNKLVALREQAEAAWADIDVQLKRRHDLIPNLVETVKGYASHEQETFDAVIEARSRAMSAEGPAEAGAAESLLGGALGRLFALAEAYPDLKASDGFRDLQQSLASLEGAIQNARRYYNAVVRDFNTKVQTVPSALIARSFGFRQREFFEIEESERAVPEVDFDS
ncbi:MAG TPA: LemA family protein [Longimicrobiales bacterium]|nr:LemA family protein [Longimicrobiales bacterium]